MGNSYGALAILALAAFGLGACAGGLEEVAETSDVVTLEHSPDRASDADDLAQSRCGNYGKKAKLRAVHNQTAFERLTIYDCVPR
ncbi:MAG: hypothetical protein HY246_15935 [Proteobacteria bacterium]|nr:hypothetical protein [Pseudomonadota bacterium]